MWGVPIHKSHPEERSVSYIQDNQISTLPIRYRGRSKSVPGPYIETGNSSFPIPEDPVTESTNFSPLPVSSQTETIGRTYYTMDQYYGPWDHQVLRSLRYYGPWGHQGAVDPEGLLRTFVFSFYFSTFNDYFRYSSPIRILGSVLSFCSSLSLVDSTT